MPEKDNMYINGLKRLLSDIYRLRVFILSFCAVFILFNILFHKICFFSIVSGYPCPGCGITRAFACLITLHWHEAMLLNPTIFLWFPVLVYGFLNRYFFCKSNKIFTKLLIITGILTIIIYIIRMILLFPHTEPMTYSEQNLINFFFGLFKR